MLRTPQAIIILILMIGSLVLNAVQEKFDFYSQEITLEFDNVKIKDIDFYNGDQIIVKYGKKENLMIEQVENVLAISGELEPRISLKLPKTKSYKFVKDDAVCLFNSTMLEINTGEEVVRFTKDKLEVMEGDKTKVEIGERGIIVDDDGEHVEIGSEGIIIEGEENTELTGFWGQLLGSIIKSIARTSISFAGKRPEKIAKYIINDEEDENAYTYSLGLDLDDSDHYEKVISEEYYPQSNSKLNLHNINGSIKVKKWDKDHLEMEITKRTNHSEEELDQVEIKVSEGKEFSITTEHLKKNPKVSVQYKLNIPEHMNISELVTSNGAISIEGCKGNGELITSNGMISIEEHTGNIKARTSNGSIDAENVKGEVNGSTSNGRIDFENISDVVSANTSNGSIEINQCPKLSKVHTSNGRIEMEILHLYEDLDVVTSNSSVRIYVSSSVDADLEASTNNGKIMSNHPRLHPERTTKNFMSGKLGEGGYRLMIQTSNSNIHIDTLEDLL